MAIDLITFRAPLSVQERSAVTIAAHFRDRAAFTSAVPSNVYWRLDTEDGCQIADWTSIAPAAEVSIPISAEQNRIWRCNLPSEAKVLTVMADRGLPSQFVGSCRYDVRNLPWRTA